MDWDDQEDTKGRGPFEVTPELPVNYPYKDQAGLKSYTFSL